MAGLCGCLSGLISQSFNCVRKTKSHSNQSHDQSYEELKAANQERENFLRRTSVVINPAIPEGMFDSHAPPPPPSYRAATKDMDRLGSSVTCMQTSGNRYAAEEVRARGRDGIIRQSIGLREDERIEARDMATS